jgi:hypothetical protein
MRKFDPSVKDLLTVARAYSHEDDWSVPSIYIDTLVDLARDLLAGDDPAALASHAKHAARDCARHNCAIKTPSNVGRDEILLAMLVGQE